MQGTQNRDHGRGVLACSISSRAVMLVLVVVMMCVPTFGQTGSIFNVAHPLYATAQGIDRGSSSFPETDAPDRQAASPDSTRRSQPQEGLIRRSVKRTLRDQKEIYLAPMRPSNFKWDVFMLAGSGALLATDRRIERHLPGGNLSIYSNASNVALGGLSGTLALMWAYGLKTHNEHLKEMGSLELEILVNTFLVYTPMQVIAGRQRPGEGNNRGDFWRHHAINTSFPAGHPMFSMAMAAVVAHEYPKTWVKVLAYGAATAVIGGRLLGRHHWSSDVFVGPALGYFIGSHIFYSHCDPTFNEACHSH
jgi:hypothetical protein